MCQNISSWFLGSCWKFPFLKHRKLEWETKIGLMCFDHQGLVGAKMTQKQQRWQQGPRQGDSNMTSQPKNVGWLKKGLSSISSSAQKHCFISRQYFRKKTSVFRVKCFHCRRSSDGDSDVVRCPVAVFKHTELVVLTGVCTLFCRVRQVASRSELCHNNLWQEATARFYRGFS